MPDAEQHLSRKAFLFEVSSYCFGESFITDGHLDAMLIVSGTISSSSFEIRLSDTYGRCYRESLLLDRAKIFHRGKCQQHRSRAVSIERVFLPECREQFLLLPVSRQTHLVHLRLTAGTRTVGPAPCKLRSRLDRIPDPSAARSRGPPSGPPPSLPRHFTRHGLPVKLPGPPGPPQPPAAPHPRRGCNHRTAAGQRASVGLAVARAGGSIRPMPAQARPRPYRWTAPAASPRRGPCDALL